MSVRLRLVQLARDVRDSYWFLPGVIAVAGIILGLGLVLLDARLGDVWLGRYEWFYGSRPEGARAMLSTIAGSTITVAGVVFSITLAAVTYASGQFGPRLLGNFTRDRGNQVTLGVFIGTYLYCLVVLRTIRSAQETSADTGGAVRDAFVPHVAMFGGLALAILSTGVLIYFVHHVTAGIQIDRVIARVGRDLIDDVRGDDVRGDDVRGDDVRGDEDGPDAPEATEPDAGRLNAVLTSMKAGYIASVDWETLLAAACRHDLILTPLRRAGDFVAAGRPLLSAASRQALEKDAREECVAAFALAPQRSSQQDRRFAIDELVEIAARALSPGVNDPFTAIACIDWLGAALGEIERRPTSRHWLSDERGSARVLCDPLGFEDYLQCAIGQLRPYVAADPNARRSTLQTLETLANGAHDGRHRALIRAEHQRLSDEGEQK